MNRINLRILGALLIAVSLVGTASASEITGTLSGGGSGLSGSVTSAPTASPAPGNYSSAQSVTLSDPGTSSIRYTVDGTSPSCAGAGLLYTAPITVASSETIEAIGCFPSGSSSSVASFSYVISGGGLSGTVGTSSSGSLSGSVTSSPGGSLSGTVTGSGGSLSGTVGGSSSGGGGGGGGGSSSGGGGGGGGIITQPTSGGGGGTVLGTSTEEIPGVPDTGAGGNAPLNILLLMLAAAAAIIGIVYLEKDLTQEPR